MKNLKIFTIIVVAALSCCIVYGEFSSLSPIKINGNAFIDSKTGRRFYIRGVDYQPGGSSKLKDPLSDPDNCKRDIAVFKDLGINTVRVYSVDNSKDHSECMEALENAGIYLLLDVNTPQASLSRIDPKCSYNANYLQNVFATIDSFARYNNVLGFFGGNEVINDVHNTFTAPYVKAVVRDMKKYMRARNYRRIPVGYSAADIASNRELAAEYFNCGEDDDARVDMFGVNDYSWCGNSNFQKSGYSTKMKIYKDYSIPIFLSEFGCNQGVIDGRPFTEIGAIYSDEMTSVFSGGLVYEYSSEANDYGLVRINGDTVSKTKDFENLKKEYAAHPNPSGDGGYSSSKKHSNCPPYEKNIWEANSTLPDMPSAASAYFKRGGGIPQGIKASTQNDCGLNAHYIPAGGGNNSGMAHRNNNIFSTCRSNSSKSSKSSHSSSNSNSGSSKSSRGSSKRIIHSSSNSVIHSSNSGVAHSSSSRSTHSKDANHKSSSSSTKTDSTVTSTKSDGSSTNGQKNKSEDAAFILRVPVLFHAMGQLLDLVV